MITHKKNPKKQLEKYSNIFMQIGLMLVLFITYTLVEYKTEVKKIDFTAEAQTTETLFPTVYDVYEIEKVKKEVVKKLPPKEIILEHIDKRKDDEKIPETLIADTQVIPKFDVNTLETVNDPDPDIEEEVDFIVIEDVPVFPGCSGDNKALKDCFNKKMQKHFTRKFDSELPNNLGLQSGRKRLIMLFKIDKTGNIVDIRVKAPHPRLEKEAERIVKLLPKMKPGKQRGRPVGVKYTLPMRIDVE